MLDEIRKKIASGNQYRIVFVGDSLTSCEWVHPNWREIVEYVLKQELGERMGDWKLPSWNIRCINSGLDGSTTDDYLSRLDEYVLRYTPDMVIVMLGGNDRFLSKPQKTKENLTQILTQLRSKVETIVLSTDPRSSQESYNHEGASTQNEIRSFAVQSDIFVDMENEMSSAPLEDIYTFISEEDNADVGISKGDIDFIHPNPLGNAYIAGIFLKKIFGISFDARKYISDTEKGKMFPSY